MRRNNASHRLPDLLFGIAVSVLGLTLLFAWLDPLPALVRRADLKRLATEEYSAVFFSMISPGSFQEEDFSYYLALPTLKAAYRFPDLEKICFYFESGVPDTRELSHVFLGLDLLRISKACGYDHRKITQTVEEDLIPFITARPDTFFRILLSYPSLESWCGLPPDETDKILDACRVLLPLLFAQPNVTVFSPGSEEWLIANPGNYQKDDLCQPEVSRQILLLTLVGGNGRYLLTPDNLEERLNRLEDLIRRKRDAAPLPDYSDLSLVFLGDSIIGNYTGSLSIPGVVGGLCRATVYNCGYGGMSAAQAEGGSLSFPLLVDSLTTGDVSALPQDKPVYSGFLELAGKSPGNLCFFINFGLNDYFNGAAVSSKEPYDLRTFIGALRLGITRLQTAYPHARIVLMTPNYTTYFSSGTETKSEVGGVLADYVGAELALAEELSVYCMNNYVDLGISEKNQAQLLADGCHLNEAGRFLLGTQIVEKLKAVFPR